MTFRIIGFLGIAWALMMRFYTMSADRNRIINLSMPNRLCTTNIGQNDSVPWLLLFRRSSFWAMVIAHACQNNCFFVLLSWLPTYFHEEFPHSKVIFVHAHLENCISNLVGYVVAGLDSKYGSVVGIAAVYISRQIHHRPFDHTWLAGDKSTENRTKLLFSQWKCSFTHFMSHEELSHSPHVHDDSHRYVVFLNLFSLNFWFSDILIAFINLYFARWCRFPQ